MTTRPPPSGDSTALPWPGGGRLAAVDYGTVRIGIAICDAERRFASPLDNYTRRGPVADAAYFRALAATEHIGGWIVGLPVHGDGRESQKSRECRQFGAWLARQTGLPVAYFDERYTTVQADEILNQAELTSKQRRERRDKLAAQILLTAYLEAPQRLNASPEALD